MEKIIYGNIKDGLELVERGGKLFVRYDAGAHQIIWREDEITEEEANLIQQGTEKEQEVMFALQNRLEQNGQDPYKRNWDPKRKNT